MWTRPSHVGRLVAALVVPVSLAAQAPFEGVITYRMTIEGRQMDMRFFSKGNKGRMEMQIPDMPGEMFVLMDLDREVMQSVMPAMGIYVEMDLKQMAAMAGAQADSAPPFRKLGTADEILGIRCENYRFGPPENEETEACVATGMGWFMGGPMGGGPLRGRSSGPNLAAYREAFKDGMLPLRTSVLVNGRWQVLFEATAIERKALEDRLFVLPPGLQKVNMPAG